MRGGAGSRCVDVAVRCLEGKSDFILFICAPKTDQSRLDVSDGREQSFTHC